MFSGSFSGRITPRFIAITAVLVTPVLFAITGCGGGDSSGSGSLPATLPTPTPAPVVTPSPGVSPVPSPIVSPTPSPSPVPVPPASGETLALNQGVSTVTNVSADFNGSNDAVYPFNDGWAIGASRPALGDKGNSAQVYFSDVKNNIVRSVTFVVADRSGVKEGQTYSLGPVTTEIKDKNAFVIFTTRNNGDTANTTLKQWQSVGGQVIVERFQTGEIKLRVIDAQMQPFNNGTTGQAGTFTLTGAGYSAVQ